MRLLNRLYITCLLGIVIVTTNAQNRYWVFPPNYVDFYTGQVLPLPNTAISPATNVSFVDIVAGSSSTIPGNPLNKSSDYIYLNQGVSNGILNESGSLEYYLNNKVFVTNGRTVLYNSSYGQDLPILPVPGECGKFFLVTGAGALTLNYKKVELAGTTIGSYSTSVPSGNPVATVFAVGKLKYNSLTGTPYYKMYTLGESYLYEFQVTQSGISFLNSYSNYYYFSSMIIPGELELSPNERYIAWSYPLADGYLGIKVTDLVTGEVETYTTDNATGDPVLGLEFSFSSDKIFFSLSNKLTTPDRNKLGYFSLRSGALINSSPRHYQLGPSDIVYIQGTQALPGSVLERGVDGYIYVSDGSFLRGFDPEHPNLGVIKSIEISNPITTVSRGIGNELSYYSLVNQIEGADHTNLFKVGCDISQTVSNVTSLDGSLKPIVQASNIVETFNTVLVVTGTSVTFKAGDEILLKPGFTVNAGGNFRGVLQPCDDFVIDYCSGGARVASYEDTSRQETDKSFIDVFPNLTSGIVNLKTGNAIKLISVQVVSSEGKRVLTDDLSGREEVTLNVSHLSDGVYILQIRHQGGIETRRIILIK